MFLLRKGLGVVSNRFNDERAKMEMDALHPFTAYAGRQ